MQLVPVRGLVQDLREVKDDGEIALIARACRIGDDALAALLDRVLEIYNSKPIISKLAQ